MEVPNFAEKTCLYMSIAPEEIGISIGRRIQF